MWKVYCDEFLLYHTELEEYQISEPSLDLELNKTGSFSFTIYQDHINYDKLKKLKSIITVCNDDTLYFRGRILNDEVGWYNEKRVTCEGDLAFFNDSIQRPFKFPIDENEATPQDYLEYLVSNHNSQVDESHQFTVGNVTVVDPNDYIARSDTEYSTTWTLINQGLIDTLGGYLWVRHENGINYLDYLADFNVLSNQPIEFGVNLLDLKKEHNGEDIATAIVPIGATVEEEVTDPITGETTKVEKIITIEEVPDEETSDVCKTGDYVYSKLGYATYGKICKMVKFDDITSPYNLLLRAKSELAKTVLLNHTLELSAADLSATGQNFNSFKLGTCVTAKSTVHGVSTNYLVKKLTIDLLNPANNQIALGETIFSFTEDNQKQQAKAIQNIKTNVEISQTQAIAELEKRTSSALLQTENSILSTVSDGYYTKNDSDRIVSEVSTEFQQTADKFELRFNTFNQDLTDIQAGTDTKFEEIKEYIRFENGNIILGEEGNELILRLENDRISFLSSNFEVAYFSNQKLYVTDGEYLNSLKIGKFAFVPRENGNLSFVKVVN